MTVAPMVPAQMAEQRSLALFLHAMSSAVDNDDVEAQNSSLSLDLGEQLLRNPKDTFATYAGDDSLAERGMYDGDLLLVDKVLKPQHDDIVIISIDGELQCRILDMKESRLVCCDETHSPILLDEQIGLVVEGVVIQIIRSLR